MNDQTAMTARRIYLIRDNQQLGPYSVDEIARNLEAGAINPGDFAWHEGLAEWTPLSHVLSQIAAETVAATPAHITVNHEQPEPGFFRAVAGAFFYPFRGTGGLLIFVFGIGFIILLTVVRFAFIFGFLASLLLTGYYFAFLFKIIRDTAMEAGNFAEFPDLSDIWDDVCLPFIQVFIALLVCVLPSVLAEGFINERGLQPVWLSSVLLIAGIVYLPMVLLATAIFNSVITALNPLVILPAISRIFLRYLIVFILLAATWLGAGLTSDWLQSRLHPLAALPAITFAGFYAGIIAARLLGVIYRTSSDAIGWFPR